MPTIDEMTRACEFIIKARILQVMGSKLPEKPSSRAWVVPHGLNAVIEFIGKVTQRQEALFIEPTSDAKLTEDQFKDYRKVAMFWIMMEDKMPVAYTLPRSEEGNYEFMMFLHVENSIRSSIPNAEPGTALASAFIQAECLQTVISPRFNYGTIDEYQYAVEELAAPTAGVAH